MGFRRDITEMVTEVGEYHELLYQMTLRDLLIRYKQASMGFAWAIFMPLVNTVLFSVIFTRVTTLPTDVPYPVFAYTGLLFWNFFASAIRFSATSLSGNAVLVTKIYFPREIFPFSAILVSLVDLLVGSTVLVGLMFWYHIAPRPTILLVPAVLLIEVAFAAGVALIVAMANLFLRDVKYLLELLLTVWMFATSVVYPVGLVGGRVGTALQFNPMTPIIDAFRSILLTGQWPSTWPLVLAALMAGAVVLVGWLLFHRAEYKFAEYA